MKEKNFQTLFGQHLKFTSPPLSNAFELKIVKNNKPFAFAQVKEHQIAGLLTAKEGMYHKLSDFTFEQKPFDCFWLVANHSWIIIYFYHPRKPKQYYGIEIDDFVKLKKEWKKKSIREEEMMKTGYFRVLKLKLPPKKDKVSMTTS